MHPKPHQTQEFLILEFHITEYDPHYPFMYIYSECLIPVRKIPAKSKLINLKRQMKNKNKPSCCAEISAISDRCPRAESYNLLCPQTEPKTQIRINTHAHNGISRQSFPSQILNCLSCRCWLRAGHCRQSRVTAVCSSCTKHLSV